MLKKLKNKGIALFVTLALLLLLSMAVAVFLITSYNSANINEALYRRQRALTVAEAGLHYAFYQLRLDSTYTGHTFPAGSLIMLDLMPDMPAGTGWSLIITVTPSVLPEPGDSVVRAKVTYPKATVF